MKVFTVVAGAVIVVAYAVWGMLVMNHLGLVAGSGLPLDETLATMESAGERASMVFGYVFAALGVGLAGWWAASSLLKRERGPIGVLAGWCAILVGGAAAYFYTSNYNLMSLGDTFFDWHQDPLADLQRPLNLTSGLALVVLAALGLGFLARGIARRRK